MLLQKAKFRSTVILFNVGWLVILLKILQTAIFSNNNNTNNNNYITSVQRRSSSRTWFVSFISQEHKDYALEISIVIICG